MKEEMFILREAVKMIVLVRLSFLIMLVSSYSLIADQHKQELYAIYPFNSFKAVVDTCMRSYSDALLLQDRIANHDRIDDLLDVLVGRLVRLESYIEQLIYAYRYEATVSFDEMEYLARMLEYLEITVSETNYHEVGCGLNAIMNRLKQDIKTIIGSLSSHFFNQVPLSHYWSRSSVNHLHQFA